MKAHKIIRGRWVLHRPFLRGGFYTVRVRDIKLGSMRYLSTRQTTLRRAEEEALRWLDTLELTENVEAAVEFSKAYEEYLATKTDLRPETRRTYDTDGRIYAEKFGGRMLKSITIADIEVWLVALHQKGIAASTQTRWLGSLRTFLGWAHRRGYTTSNPAEGVKPPRSRHQDRQVLTHQQACQLVKAAIGATKVAVLIALHTGLRHRNVTGLLWGDVNMEARLLSLPAEKMKGRRPIILPLHSELYAVLKERFSLDREARVIGCDSLYVARGFKTALTAAGLPSMRFHDLRHTFATWLAPIAPHAILQAILAHAPKTVTDLYTRNVSLQEKRAVIERLPPLLTAPKEGTKLVEEVS